MSSYTRHRYNTTEQLATHVIDTIHTEKLATHVIDTIQRNS